MCFQLTRLLSKKTGNPMSLKRMIRTRHLGFMIVRITAKTTIIRPSRSGSVRVVRDPAATHQYSADSSAGTGFMGQLCGGEPGVSRSKYLDRLGSRWFHYQQGAGFRIYVDGNWSWSGARCNRSDFVPPGQPQTLPTLVNDAVNAWGGPDVPGALSDRERILHQPL